jgi:hypothetical protein
MRAVDSRSLKDQLVKRQIKKDRDLFAGPVGADLVHSLNSKIIRS